MNFSQKVMIAKINIFSVDFCLDYSSIAALLVRHSVQGIGLKNLASELGLSTSRSPNGLGQARSSVQTRNVGRDGQRCGASEHGGLSKNGAP